MPFVMCSATSSDRHRRSKRSNDDSFSRSADEDRDEYDDEYDDLDDALRKIRKDFQKIVDKGKTATGIYLKR